VALRGTPPTNTSVPCGGCARGSSELQHRKEAERLSCTVHFQGVVQVIGNATFGGHTDLPPVQQGSVQAAAEMKSTSFLVFQAAGFAKLDELSNTYCMAASLT
jgi:hypothetical protein